MLIGSHNWSSKILNTGICIIDTFGPINLLFGLQLTSDATTALMACSISGFKSSVFIFKSDSVADKRSHSHH